MKCFIIALKSEAESLLSLLDKKSCIEVFNLTIYSGSLFGESVCVLICGVGKVNAARGTQYAIDTIGADTLINIGTSGGLNDELEIGKIYAVDKVMQFDVDLVQINRTAIGVLNEFDTAFFKLNSSSHFSTVVCATADRFNDNKSDFELITNLGCTVRDMELGAIAQVCKHANIKCYAFKVISDLHGSSTTEQYKINLSLCAKNIAEQAKNILDATND